MNLLKSSVLCHKLTPSPCSTTALLVRDGLAAGFPHSLVSCLERTYCHFEAKSCDRRRIRGCRERSKHDATFVVPREIKRDLHQTQLSCACHGLRAVRYH